MEATHDVLVVGAGLAGMRAAIEAYDLGADVALLSKIHPVRSHSGAAEGGINAALGNASEDSPEEHAFDTVKGSDYLGDQDAIEILCDEAPGGAAVCDGLCVFIVEDPTNCGACGEICGDDGGEGRICADGECTDCDALGLTDCGDEGCTDLRTSPTHCGGCEQPCAEGSQCVQGECVAGGAAAPDDDDQARKYEAADDLFTGAGLEWYEVSNWARPGRESRHNFGYWRGTDYVAIGCAAHGYTNGRRWWNVRTPERYIDRIAAGESPEAGSEQLEPDASAEEALALALRTRDGAPVANPEVIDALGEMNRVGALRFRMQGDVVELDVRGA